MAKLIIDIFKYKGKKNIKLGDIFWSLVPQVGHAVNHEFGFDFIGKVEIIEKSIKDYWIIKPIKILHSLAYPQAKEGEILEGVHWSNQNFFTEREVFDLKNKDLVIKLLFEGIDLLKKMGAPGH